MPNVKLHQFEGPLELLLELITTEKLEISQIALAEVTDQYLSAISDINAVPPGDLADFLIIAATLLLIKSRALLPRLSVSEEEELAMVSLEDRLREYRRYRQAGKALKALFESEAKIFTRPLWAEFIRPKDVNRIGEFFAPPRPPSVLALAAALKKLVSELDALLRPVETKVIARIISVEEKIKEILERVNSLSQGLEGAGHEPLTINDLSGSRSRAELILAFLALLFLFQKKTIMITQAAGFGLIEIQKTSESQ